MPDRQRPDHFLIIGAQRCGTTYLSRLLDEHPEIEMAKPFRPEPKFFLDDDRYPLGLEYYESEFFSESRARVRGEKSTSYIESELAARRINATLPDAKVIVAVRDPVRRAISNYRFSVEHGVETLPMAEALQAAEHGREWDRARFSVSPFDYLARGRYADYLERWAESAGHDNLRVLVFEELVADAEILAGLYDDLGVDATFRPDGIRVPVNVSAADDESVDTTTGEWLFEYFREPNRRLEAFLGRRLPWPS